MKLCQQCFLPFGLCRGLFRGLTWYWGCSAAEADISFPHCCTEQKHPCWPSWIKVNWQDFSLLAATARGQYCHWAGLGVCVIHHQLISLSLECCCCCSLSARFPAKQQSLCSSRAFARQDSSSRGKQDDLMHSYIEPQIPPVLAFFIFLYVVLFALYECNAGCWANWFFKPVLSRQVLATLSQINHLV